MAHAGDDEVIDPIIRDNKGRIVTGPGRVVGSVNHLSKTVKETVLAVFNEIQNDPKVKLSQFAKDYPRDFYAIAARLIPTDIKADIRVNKVLLEVERTTNGTQEDQASDLAPETANGTE